MRRRQHSASSSGHYTFSAPSKKHEENTDDWLITFADMATLLLCFFIIMFALTYAPKDAYEKISESLRTQGFSSSTSKEDPFETLVSDLQVSLGASGFDQFLHVKTTPGRVDIELASTSFFTPGSAQLKREAVPVLEHVRAQLQPFMKQSDMLVKVEGHTDDTPTRSAQFPSNWELSSARASNVVRFFIAGGIPPARLVVTGHADTRPKLANRDATGKPILENQHLNRRVTISLSRKDGG